jgi:ankyrin repeat protein
LYWAVFNGQLEIAKLLKERGANINAVNKFNRTPLKEAISGNKGEIIEWLCQQDEIDVNKGNCLIEAIYLRNEKAIQFLLEKKVNINQENDQGRLPLEAATYSLDLVRKLINLGAKIKDNFLILLMSAIWNEEEGLFQKFKELLELLIKNGVNINFQDAGRNPALILACTSTYNEVIKLLIENKANINCQDKKGNTPLIILYNFGEYDMVEFLIQNGADINCPNKKGNTLLILACKHGDRSMVELLMKYGADADISNKSGETPFDLVKKLDYQQILFLLSSYRMSGFQGLK